MARYVAILLMAGALVSSCGQDDLATLAIKVHSPALTRDSLRRFPPGQPLPDRIQVKVLRSDDIMGKEVSMVDLAWNELEQDPSTQKKFLLVNVQANEDKDYRYLLRLSSVVGGVVDECGAIGQILAVKGAKKQLEIVTHLDDCSSVLCQNDADCPGNQYCLSFECYNPDGTCDCPEGAYCKDLVECSADCSTDESICTNDFTCCYGICSAHCPKP